MNVFKFEAVHQGFEFGNFTNAITSCGEMSLSLRTRKLFERVWASTIYARPALAVNTTFRLF